jgi:hypothetical protein
VPSCPNQAGRGNIVSKRAGAGKGRSRESAPTCAVFGETVIFERAAGLHPLAESRCRSFQSVEPAPSPVGQSSPSCSPRLSLPEHRLWRARRRTIRMPASRGTVLCGSSSPRAGRSGAISSPMVAPRSLTVPAGPCTPRTTVRSWTVCFPVWTLCSPTSIATHSLSDTIPLPRPMSRSGPPLTGRSPGM